jgi:hypothetical protein
MFITRSICLSSSQDEIKCMGHDTIIKTPQPEKSYYLWVYCIRGACR